MRQYDDKVHMHNARSKETPVLSFRSTVDSDESLLLQTFHSTHYIFLKALET